MAARIGSFDSRGGDRFVSSLLSNNLAGLLAVLLLVGGVGLLALPLVRRAASKRHAPRATPMTLEQRAAKGAKLAAQQDEIEQLVAEAREAITLGIEQLDARLARLEGLIALADEKLERAGGAKAGVGVAERRERVSAATRPTVSQPAIEVRPLRVGPSDESAPAWSAAGQSADGASLPAYAPHAPHAAHAATDPTTVEVFALADAGKSPVEIAAHLGEHVGKVELMLALRRG